MKPYTVKPVTWRDRLTFDVLFLDRFKVVDDLGQTWYSDTTRKRCEWWIRQIEWANDWT